MRRQRISETGIDEGTKSGMTRYRMLERRGDSKAAWVEFMVQSRQPHKWPPKKEKANPPVWAVEPKRSPSKTTNGARPPEKVRPGTAMEPAILYQVAGFLCTKGADV